MNKECSKGRAAGIAVLVALAAAVVLSWKDINRVQPVVLVATMFAHALGLWAIGGVSMFFSAPENRTRNWLVLMVIWAGLMLAQQFME